MGLLLAFAGLVFGLYSLWFQQGAREAIVSAMNKKDGTSFALKSVRVKFPLQISLEGLELVEHGDTMMRAGAFDADISLLPLLTGKVDVKEARLNNARYQMGTRDSATCIVINAADVRLDPASVRLVPMHIDVRHADMSEGTVDIYINPCPPPAPPVTEPPSQMTIDARVIDLHDFTFRLNMMPVIDSLGTHIDYARLSDGHIDLLGQNIKVGDFSGHGLDAAYIVPDSAAIAATKVSTDSTASKPWTVTVDRIDFDKVKALYTTRGYKPEPGLDFGYIALDKGTLSVENFYNRATDVTVPLSLSGTERCGVDLSLGGTLKVSETRLNFDAVRLTTPKGTRLDATGMMGVGNPMEDTTLPLAVTASGKASCADLGMMFPYLNPYFRGLSPSALVDADIDMRGNMARVEIGRLRLAVDGSLSIDASGDIADVLDPEHMSGHVQFGGKIGNLSPWRKMLAEALGEVRIPPMTLEGDVDFGSDSYEGNIVARTREGRLALDGSFNGNYESYDLSLSTERFPVDAFMPGLGVGEISADIDARGRGLDLFSASTKADVNVDLRHVVYNRQTLRDIKGTVTLDKGQAAVNLVSHNPGADLDLDAKGNLSGNRYDWTAVIDSRNLDLHALGLSESPMAIAGRIDLDASVNARRYTLLSATLDIPALTYTDSIGPLKMKDVRARIDATETTTNVSMSNGDLYAYFASPDPLDSLLARMDVISAALDEQMKQRRIDIEQMQRALPQFSLNIDGGNKNVVSDYLAQSGIALRRFSVDAINDSIFTLDSRAIDLRMGQTKMDTITFDVRQNGNRLDYEGRLRNRPGTLDEWAQVDLNGYFRPGRLGMDLHQRNIQGKTGYQLGAYIDLSPADSTATLHISPLDPTIGYQQWLVNEDNAIEYNFATKHLDAFLKMRSEVSSIELITEHAGEADEHLHGDKENLLVRLTDIRIQDWINLNPFAPPVKGNLSADMKLNYHEGHLMANGKVSLAELFYGRQKVGNFDADMNMETMPGGKISADMALSVDGRKSLTLKGVLNDSTQTSPFLLDMTMIHFPLSTVNAFVPDMARLSGTLNGEMNVTGKMTEPILDGYLQFDSTNVYVNMLGTSYALSDVRIPVEKNDIRMNNFTISGCNENPLYINGNVNMHSFSNVGIDLAMHANNMQIVKSDRAAKGAEVYGRGFINLDATAKGSLDYLDINASLQLNSGSNVTYVMTDAEEVIQSQSTSEMVRFVNFNDSSAVAAADSIAPSGMLMNINALVTVATGTTINVDLDTKGQNKIQLQSQGTLNYTQTPMMEEGRLTGRLNISKGFVRYTPPLMSEKLFKFDDNSYVAFSGDMLNPQLNIHAVDNVRANVTQEGQNSRLIYFDVALGVTGTLNNMDVVFDLSTDDDVTIANELQSMSPSQRASQAMNLLLYNVYTGPGTKANANLSGNPLYSFLTSQLNSWAANTIKGVDLSFGIDQYNRTNQGVSQQTTSYSYKVSKSLFNDRFKIAVGGNYSTDVDANQNLAQNLFNDISLEYTLNKSGTMYVKIFRHTGFESILEGEITQTGVGFVYKRKIRRLSDMFRFKRRKKLQQTNFVPEVEKESSEIPKGIPLQNQNSDDKK